LTLNILSQTISTVSLLSINSALYQNAGATIVQQIAYSLGHANEYFNRVEQINKPIVLKWPLGPITFEIANSELCDYFFTTIAKEYNHNIDCNIIVSPTKRNKTIYDYNVNMLRTTTECMSAITVQMQLPIYLMMRCTTKTMNLVTE
jgi:methylmalonyl-CoA mutase